MSDNVRVLTDASWEEDVLKAEGPVLVDFWAPWCPPCRMIAPVIDAVGERYSGRARVGKLNVDDNPITAARYDIRSIPTLLVFQGGRVVEQRVGALPPSEIADLIERQLVGAPS
ncbi:MAG TPA: thioredoxin [Vicinamibacteria bacterium]